MKQNCDLGKKILYLQSYLSTVWSRELKYNSLWRGTPGSNGLKKIGPQTFNLATGAHLSFSVTSVPVDKKPLSILHWAVQIPAPWLEAYPCTDNWLTQATSVGLASDLFSFWEAVFLFLHPTTLALHPMPKSAITFLPLFPKSGGIGSFKKSVD